MNYWKIVSFRIYKDNGFSLDCYVVALLMNIFGWKKMGKNKCCNCREPLNPWMLIGKIVAFQT